VVISEYASLVRKFYSEVSSQTVLSYWQRYLLTEVMGSIPFGFELPDQLTVHEAASG